MWNKIYNSLKKIYRKLIKLGGRYKFENRKKDYSKLCIVIAGYKPFLYDTVFRQNY